MGNMEQRRVGKKYLDAKYKELKTKSKDNVAQRINELSKLIRVNEATVNLDSLTGSKVDPKVMGILLGEILILEKVEIVADRSMPHDVEKMY